MLAAAALREASEQGLELELGYAMFKGRPTVCKYKGVKLCNGRGHERRPWQARIGAPAVALGTFETAEQAALHRARYLRDQQGGMQPGDAPKRRCVASVPDEDKQFACPFPGTLFKTVKAFLQAADHLITLRVSIGDIGRHPHVEVLL